MIPYRVCCMKQHIGPVCPDNTVMCCFCFDKVELDELATDPDDGQKIDVCQPCWDWEQEALATRERFYEDHEGSI